MIARDQKLTPVEAAALELFAARLNACLLSMIGKGASVDLLSEAALGWSLGAVSAHLSREEFERRFPIDAHLVLASGVSFSRARTEVVTLRVGDRVRRRGDLNPRPEIGLVRKVMPEGDLPRVLVEWTPTRQSDAPSEMFVLVSEADESAHGAGDLLEIEKARLRVAVGLLNDVDRVARQIASFLEAEAKR